MDDGTISKSDDFAAAWDAPQKGALDQAELDRLTDELVTALKTVFDPEIPVDIVELGLIYKMEVTEGDGTNKVDITMTLTAPGCGMGEYIKQDVENKVATVPNVTDVHVDLTFDPPWDRTMMSDTAKLALGMY